MLAFMVLYKLGDSMATALATPFYLDMGFTKTEIGLIAKHAGLWPSVIGGLIGGIWMLKLGINRALWLFGVVQVVSILGFALLTEFPQDRVMLAVVISFEALGVGLGTVAFVAYIARATHPLYTATQFALFTSLAAAPRVVINSVTGVLVEQTGWLNFFLHLHAAGACPACCCCRKSRRGTAINARGRTPRTRHSLARGAHASTADRRGGLLLCRRVFLLAEQILDRLPGFSAQPGAHARHQHGPDCRTGHGAAGRIKQRRMNRARNIERNVSRWCPPL